MSSQMRNEPKIDPEEILGGIVEWVEIESPSHDAAAVNKVVTLVEGQFRDLGAQMQRTPGVDGFADILKARTPWGGDGPGILVLAHLDTVHPIALGLLVLGGLIYTAGVFVFISPTVKFRRAIWHGFVVTGATVHWAAVLVGVVLAPAAMG